jgi:uncharacterized membrane protein
VVVKPKFSAMQEHCHTKLLATLYSLLAAVLPFATRYSPFAICRSLFAIRHSLLAAVLARQEPRLPIFATPTEVGGYEMKPAKAG